MSKDLAHKTKVGIIWSAANIVFSKSFRLIASIVLARLLFPEDFGLYGIALIIIRFARKISNMGFSSVIVQRKELTKQEINTIFTVSLGINVLIGVLLFFGAPLFASWVDEPKATPVVQLISSTFLMAAFTLVSQNMLKRDMRFKELAFSGSARSVVGLLLPIVLAVLNFGVWSLILGEVFGTFAAMLVAMIYARWIPKIYFKLQAFKNVYAYGLKVSAVSYLNYFINNIDYLLISKFLGVTQLGYYERAFNLMNLTRRQLGRTVNDTLFSAYSKIKDDKMRVVNNLKKILGYVSLIAYPVLIWLFFAAPSLIFNMYGAKWTSTIVPLQIMSVSGLINTLIMVFFPVTLALDLMADRMKAQLLFLMALIGFIYLLVPYKITGVAIAVVISTSVYAFAMIFVIKKNLPFGFTDFIQTQKTPLLYGFIQILFSVAVLKFGGFYFDSTSIFMFFSISMVTLIAFGTSHLFFRKADYQNLIAEFTSTIKRKTAKVKL